MKGWPILLLSIALSGCARFTPQPITAQDAAADYEGRSLADESLHHYIETNLHCSYPIWPPAKWDLETLTLAAFYFNPDLAVARTRYDSVDAGRITARQRPNPTVTVSPLYNTTTAIPSPWLVTATLDLPIETAGKRRYRQTQAHHLLDAASFALVDAAWNVRVRLRRSLVEVWAAQQKKLLFEKQEEAQQTIVRLLEIELAAGGISPTEVARERMALAQTKLLRLEAQSSYSQAETRLAEAIGVSVLALNSVAISFEAFERPPAELPTSEARRRALLNRSDILGALADYAASESALQLEIAKQYPNIHLNPGYEFDQGDNKWGVGLSLELPLLNQNRGPIAEAEAHRRELGAKFQAAQARVLGEIEGALAGCRNAKQKFELTTELLAQAQTQDRRTEELVKAGELSRQAAAATHLEMLHTESARLDALLQVQQAAATLESALQLPLELPDSFIHPHSQMGNHP